MTREAAQRAMHKMQGTFLLGNALRMDWGKPVPLPAKPQYIHPTITENPLVEDDDENVIRVQIPDNSAARSLIHWAVQQVLEHGHLFEQVLIQAYKDNPSFQFITDINHPLHHYYKWRIYSLLCQEDIHNWRMEPFQMVEGGPQWFPPERHSAAKFNSKTALTEEDRDEARAETIPEGDTDIEDDTALRNISPRVVKRLRSLCVRLTDSDFPAPRNVIARIMSLAISCGEAAPDVCAEIVRQFPGTTAEGQMSLLHVINDILHNSVAPVTGAWRYRDALKDTLPTIFQLLMQTYQNLKKEYNRRKADTWRADVFHVMGIWRAAMVYPRSVFSGLESILKPEVEEAEEGAAVGTIHPTVAALLQAEPAGKDAVDPDSDVHLSDTKKPDFMKSISKSTLPSTSGFQLVSSVPVPTKPPDTNLSFGVAKKPMSSGNKGLSFQMNPPPANP
jgi:U2-associated protein SR140